MTAASAAASTAVRRGRGRPRALTESDVIDAAMDLAQRDRVTELSMRELARRLGVPLTTLYGYVPSKRALEELVVDQILSEVRVPDADEGTWDVRLSAMLGDARRVLVERPQVAHSDPGAHGAAIVLVHNGGFCREASRLATAVLELLSEGGFEGDDTATCFGVLFTYVTGYADPYRVPADLLPGDTSRAASETFAVGLDALIHGLEHSLLGRHAAPARSAEP